MRKIYKKSEAQLEREEHAEFWEDMWDMGSSNQKKLAHQVLTQKFHYDCDCDNCNPSTLGSHKEPGDRTQE